MATVRSSELLGKLEDPNLILRERRLCWFGHVERSSGVVRCRLMAGRGGGGGGGGREAKVNMEETDVARLL